MQNVEENEENTVNSQYSTLKKSFLNFTLRKFHELYKQDLEERKLSQGWDECKKYGVSILKQVWSRENESYFPFQNFLIYQMPLLILKAKTKNKKQYFKCLEEIIYLGKIVREEDSQQFEKKLRKKKGYFTNENKLQIQQEKKNYLTLIGRKIRKLVVKSENTMNGLKCCKYYGKRQIKDLIKKIAQDNQIQLNETDKIKQIVERKLQQLKNEVENQNKKKKLKIMIKSVKSVLSKIIEELKDAKQKEQQ